MNGFKKLVIIETDGSTKWIQAQVDLDGVLRAGEKFCYNQKIMTAADISAVQSGADMPEKALRMGMNAGGREVLTAEDFRNREFNAAAEAAGLQVEIKTTSGRDEAGKITVYHYKFASGREWIERNLFDVGRVINPAFSVFENGPVGGLVGSAPTALFFIVDDKSRKLTAEEAAEYCFVSEHGFAGRGIRM